jgi:hypothetical protein
MPADIASVARAARRVRAQSRQARGQRQPQPTGTGPASSTADRRGPRALGRRTRERASGRAEEPVATVWFLVSGERGTFDQLAAVLGGHGVRCVRVVDGPISPWSRRLDGLLYHRSIELQALLDGREGPRREERIIDVQWMERVLLTLGEEELERMPPAIAAAVRERRNLADKRWVARTLAAAGVASAPYLDASSVTDAEAIELLGLPLVVKADIGAASSGVRVVGDANELAGAVTELDPGRESLFFQPLLDGEVRNYGAVISAEGEVRAEVVVRQFGAGGQIRAGREVVDDPLLAAYGRTICRQLRARGAIDLEVMRGGDGNLAMIDFNARPWASMVSLRMVGIDFAGELAADLGVAPRPRRRRPPQPGAVAMVFPDELDAYMLGRRPLRALIALLVRLPVVMRWTSPRYAAHFLGLRVLWRLEGKPQMFTLPPVPARVPGAASPAPR